jgi:hypothetical protein
MKLSDPELESIIQRLRERNALRPCEACGNPNFVLSQDIADVDVVQSPAIDRRPQSIFAFAVVCKNCGNIRLHAVQTLGLESLLDTRRGQ